MRGLDQLRLTLQAVSAYRTRSLLTALGIAVGIAAVVLLTAIGEGVHRFVLAEFTQFGTNLVAVTPGKTSTFGMSGAMINTVRPLSLQDAGSLEQVHGVLAVVPVIQGNAAVERGKHSRRVMVLGVGPAVPQVWRMRPKLGSFLPDAGDGTDRAFAVLGSKLRDELFAGSNPLGSWVRIGSERFRVIGVMESKGQFLGFDLDDAVYIAASKAASLFDREGLMEIDLLLAPHAEADNVATRVRQRLVQRHGDEDFTITTQDQMLETLGDVLEVLTLAVGALGSISLLVGGVGILTILTISVTERRHEVGLLRALGARRRQILLLFLGEAAVLGGLGGLLGLAIGVGGAWLLTLAVPGLPAHASWGYAMLAEGLALCIGLLAGIMPAWHAASMDPVKALHSE